MFERSLTRRALLAPALAVAVLVAPQAAPAQEHPWGRGVPGFRVDPEAREAWREHRREERRSLRRNFIEDRDDFFDRREDFFDRREEWRRDLPDRKFGRHDRFDRHAFGRNHHRFDRHRFGRSHHDGFGRGFPPARFFEPRRHSFGGHDGFDRQSFRGHRGFGGHAFRGHPRHGHGGFRW